MKKLVMLTAYDYPTAKIIDSAGIDYILVGDSLAMSILGHLDTKYVTVEEMLHHARAVKSGAKNTHIIADLPINTYNTQEQAVRNAKRFINLGIDTVKIEGYKPEIINSLIKNNIKVAGHLGLLPQTAEKYGVVGREQVKAEELLKQAKLLDKLGLEVLILECIPSSLAKKISDAVDVPTIGIGAGSYTDGQVLVLADILGLSGKKLKMAKQYADVKQVIYRAVVNFKNEVEEGKFPVKENSFE